MLNRSDASNTITRVHNHVDRGQKRTNLRRGNQPTTELCLTNRLRYQSQTANQANQANMQQMQHQQQQQQRQQPISNDDQVLYLEKLKTLRKYIEPLSRVC